MPRDGLRPEQALLHPVWIAALGALALNDHVLKGAGVLPPMWTGKLSDVAGLIVAPALAAAVARVSTARTSWLIAIVVGGVFSVLKLSPDAATSWTALFATFGIPFRVWSDPSDLVALPAIFVSLWLVHSTASTPRPAPPSWRLIAAAGAMLCTASSPWPTARPALDAHQVYVEHHAGTLFGLDTVSGAIRAKVATEGANVFPPAVRGGIAYWMNGSRRLVAASMLPPQTSWVVNEDAGWGRYAEVAAVDEYRVYVFEFSDEARLVAVDRTFGAVAWQMEAKQLRYPVVSIAGDTVLFVNGPVMHALDARTGTEQWQLDCTDDLGSPTAAGDRVYVADDGGWLREIDLAQGTQVAATRLEGQACATYYPIAIDATSAYVCADGQLNAIELSTRRVRWKRDCRGAALVTGAVVCADGDRVMAFDATTGAARWTTEVGDTVQTAPVAGDGMVFVRNHVGKMYAVRGDTGAAAWTLDMDEGRVEAGAGR